MKGRKSVFNSPACNRNSLTYGRRYPARPGAPSLEYGRFNLYPNTVDTTWDLSVRLELVEVIIKKTHFKKYENIDKKTHENTKNKSY